MTEETQTEPSVSSPRWEPSTTALALFVQLHRERIVVIASPLRLTIRHSRRERDLASYPRDEGRDADCRREDGRTTFSSHKEQTRSTGRDSKLVERRDVSDTSRESIRARHTSAASRDRYASKLFNSDRPDRAHLRQKRTPEEGFRVQADGSGLNLESTFFA